MTDPTPGLAEPRRGILQSRRAIAILSGGAALFVVLSVILVMMLLDGVFGPVESCPEANRRAIPVLEALPILRQAPEEARFQDFVSGCDSSDHWAYAEASYFFDGERSAAVEFYRAAANAGGWTLARENRDPSVGPSELAIDPSSLCFTKDFDGFPGSLQLTFKRDIPVDAPATNDYWLGARTGAC